MDKKYNPEEEVKYWTRSLMGTPPKYDTPEELKERCIEYITKTIERNTWDEKDWVGKDSKEVTRKKRTPLLLQGLYNYLQIVPNTWKNIKSRDDNFLQVCMRVETIIAQYKLEGALTNHYNARMVGTLLGLVEKKETRELGEEPDLSKLSDSELEQYIELRQKLDE